MNSAEIDLMDIAHDYAIQTKLPIQMLSLHSLAHK